MKPTHSIHYCWYVLYFQIHIVFSYSFSSKLTAINGKTSIAFKGLWKRFWEAIAKQNCHLSSLSSNFFFFFTLIIQLVSFFHSQNWSYQCCSVQEWGLHYLSLLNWNERRLLHPWAFFPSCCYVCVYLGFFSFVLFLFCFFFIHCK